MRLILPVLFFLALGFKSAAQEEPIEYPPSSQEEGILKICVFQIEPIQTQDWIKYLRDSLELDSAFASKIPTGKYTTIIEFEADKNGYIVNAKLIMNPGFGLGEKALEDVKKYKRKALTPNASKTVRRQPVTFVIEEEIENDECLPDRTVNI